MTIYEKDQQLPSSYLYEKIFFRNYAETVPFYKFPHQNIRRNYGILRSASVFPLLRVEATKE